jgi:hypothetical protein
MVVASTWDLGEMSGTICLPLLRTLTKLVFTQTRAPVFILIPQI